MIRMRAVALRRYNFCDAANHAISGSEKKTHQKAKTVNNTFIAQSKSCCIVLCTKFTQKQNEILLKVLSESELHTPNGNEIAQSVVLISWIIEAFFHILVAIQSLSVVSVFQFVSFGYTSVSCGFLLILCIYLSVK